MRPCSPDGAAGGNRQRTKDIKIKHKGSEMEQLGRERNTYRETALAVSLRKEQASYQ